MPVQVYSGIAPPPALLARMADQPTRPHLASFQSTPSSSPQTPSPRPLNPLQPPLPPRPFVPAAAAEMIPDEPPPSYEDAIADDIGPVDGPRRDYEQQPHSNPETGDEKASGAMGRDERLFRDSGR